MRVAAMLGLTKLGGHATAPLAKGNSVRDITTVAGHGDICPRQFLKQICGKRELAGRAPLAQRW